MYKYKFHVRDIFKLCYSYLLTIFKQILQPFLIDITVSMCLDCLLIGFNSLLPLSHYLIQDSKLIIALQLEQSFIVTACFKYFSASA